ncbi:MAG: rhodanese-like domain-containing protein [Gemmatimonadaceae bacterium]|jgi:thiosulfate/3-mercaptopyruvate sulfurtransferase
MTFSKRLFGRPLLFLLALALVAPLAARSQAPAPPQPLSPAAPNPRAPLFVGVEWLAQHLNDPDIVLLHVGPASEYAAAHIPGARLVSVADVSIGDRAGPGLGVEMPGADALLARLALLGISDDSRVIVYYAKDMVYQASRILMTLTYAGLGERASLLDGGMGAWTAAGHATSAATSRARVSVLTPLRIRNFVVDARYVHSMIGAPGVSIVDARDTVFYTGARAGGSAQAPQRAGRIPGAKSVVWSMLTDGNFRIRSDAALAAAFAAAGVRPGDVIIGYCHTGQQASAMLLAARSLGYRVLLYDGSFQDWSARSELPVELGTARPND